MRNVLTIWPRERARLPPHLALKPVGVPLELHSSDSENRPLSKLYRDPPAPRLLSQAHLRSIGQTIAMLQPTRLPTLLALALGNPPLVYQSEKGLALRVVLTVGLTTRQTSRVLSKVLVSLRSRVVFPALAVDLKLTWVSVTKILIRLKSGLTFVVQMR